MQASGHTNIGTVYMTMGKYKKALEQHEAAFGLFQGYPEGQSGACMGMATAHYKYDLFVPRGVCRKGRVRVPVGAFGSSNYEIRVPGGLAQGLGIRLFAFGGAYWPLLIVTLCGFERVLVVSTEPPDDLSCLTTPGVGRPGDGLLPVPLSRCIQMHTPSPCWVCRLQH